MPYKEKTVEKLYFTIGEVAMELGVNTSLIRYWEKEMGGLKPRRTSKGDRLFERKDIDQLKRIHHLVKEKGFTLNGAREQLRSKETPTLFEAPVPVEELRSKLIKIREVLIGLRNDLSA
ncbi:MAG: MerR family transcriptional regulator [Bacteroidota bacterium]|nr:MerR family transcriptional regulator [Bacteroidota bacterium]